MRHARIRRMLLSMGLLLLAGAGTAGAEAPFSKIVVFGASLSDSGNAFALTRTASVPPYDSVDALVVSGSPFAKGGMRFSNGPVWVEYLANSLGLAESARPAFRSRKADATNYAVGGARARDVGVGSFSVQVETFLSDTDGAAPSDALYVVDMGANDIRDALAVFAGGGDGFAILEEALAATERNMEVLVAAGARTFLVWNMPNLAKTPALRILENQVPGAAFLAEYLVGMYNARLNHLVAELVDRRGIEVNRLDAYWILDELVARPDAYGLTVVDRPCITPQVPPFQCRRPDEFLFWDGLHPTTEVHGFIAEVAARALGLR